MTLHRRMVGAVMALTVLTLGGALGVISLSVNRAQERQLDEALVAEARAEAAEIAGRGESPLEISGRPGPAANDVGPLPKYGVIFDARGGAVATTPNWQHRSPRRGEFPSPDGRPFDLWVEREHLRCVVVRVPGARRVELFLGVSRTDLDGDAAFLLRAMVMVFVVACAWTFGVAQWFARRLTRGHQRIVEVAHLVASGDLSARVADQSADAEVLQLGRDLDGTIDRLATVVDAQRRFVAHAAHELRSPLTALLGEITFTLRRERTGEEYRAALGEALDATQRLHALAENLLTLARLGSSSADESGEVQLREVVDGALEDVRATSRARGIRVARVDADVAVHGHASDLRRLVRNLVENAVRHASPGGEVRVETAREGDLARVTVQDDGDGIPEEERARIFEPFFRGARTRATEDGGAGLGLAIAREIARHHRGELTCEPAAQGRGARFTMRMPARPPALGGASPHDATRRSAREEPAAPDERAERFAREIADARSSDERQALFAEIRAALDLDAAAGPDQFALRRALEARVPDLSSLLGTHGPA